MHLTKLIYRIFATSFPLFTYNPLNDNTIYSSFDVKPKSTYVNYKLNEFQVNSLKNYLKENTNDLKLKRIYLSDDQKKKDFFISINIYNCTSPLFTILNNQDITRCEINTYVVNKNKEFGTLIMDYASNFLSMDPVNIFKNPQNTNFSRFNDIISCDVIGNNFKFDLTYKLLKNNKIFNMNEELHAFSDKIFYPNGVYDKLYYDSSLVQCVSKIPKKIYNINFEFLGMKLENPDSIFYFDNELRFAGSMWDNLYDLY